MTEILEVLFILLLPLVECKYCWHTSSIGKTSHFYCGAFEYCCGSKCCENFSEFYKLWYFWLCVIILVISCALALYWLRKKYLGSTDVNCIRPETRQTRHRRRRCRRSRRYRPLEGDAASHAVTIPPNLITTPPPYSGNNTGVPHPGPPPYVLGSGSSINSRTLPSCPPSYSQIVKEPPPSYEAVFTEDQEPKKSQEDGEL